MEKIGRTKIVDLLKRTDIGLSLIHIFTPAFQVWKNGKLASIVIYIKMSRGEMTRFILKNRIENPEGLKSFSWEGFEFNESLSDEKKFVFTNGKEI